jgi:hypothetical protein
MERIQQFKDDMMFSPGDDLAEIIPTMTDGTAKLVLAGYGR